MPKTSRFAAAYHEQLARAGKTAPLSDILFLLMVIGFAYGAFLATV